MNNLDDTSVLLKTLKHISSVTLQNGGIFNLFDAYVAWLLDQTGLTDLINGQTEHYA